MLMEMHAGLLFLDIFPIRRHLTHFVNHFTAFDHWMMTVRHNIAGQSGDLGHFSR